MARVAKINDEQFVLDCINKEFEIIGSDLHWDTFKELSDWSKLPENENWFSQYEFDSKEQYNQWKAYYLEHFYDWQPKRVNKSQAEMAFAWFNLQYGLKHGFDFKLLYDN